MAAAKGNIPLTLPQLQNLIKRDPLGCARRAHRGIFSARIKLHAMLIVFCTILFAQMRTSSGGAGATSNLCSRCSGSSRRRTPRR